MSVLELHDVTRTFRGHRAVDGVTLSVEEDSIVGLLGRNGAGKTTLMSLLTGQDRPTTGSVRVLGEDPWENDAVLSRMCFIRESQQYPNNFRVRHVLTAAGTFHPRWDAELAEELLERFRLPARRQVQKLSRGMRSSLGILVGLASRAPVTVFDEPYLGLDASARQEFYDVLLKEYAEQPRTIVLSTHLIDEVAGLLERVHVLDAGRTVLSGDADDLRTRACVLTGPVAAVEQLADGLPVLHRESIGAYAAVTLDVPYDSAIREHAAALGVEVGPVSLQTLVVRTGVAA